MTFGIGPDRAESVIPWLKTNHQWPNFPWVLYARFKGESWIHCIPSNAGQELIERVAHNENRQVLATWYDPNQNRSHARFYKKGARVADLIVAGKGEVPLEVVSSQSSTHPKTFLKRCKTAGQAVESFFGALDGRLRDLRVFESTDSLVLQDYEGRAIQVDELDELAITYHAPVTATENPAATRLLPAIESADIEAARQAISDGASVEFLPDLAASPLSIVFDLPVKLAHRCPKNWRDFAKLLVEAGARIDGYDWESPPICSVIHPTAKNEAAIIECVQTILSLGGDINARDRGQNRGATPLHLAVYYNLPDMVQFLIIHGASREVRNPNGLTPLECAELRARHGGSEDYSKVIAALRAGH
jgi:hypothetical protein